MVYITLIKRGKVNIKVFIFEEKVITDVDYFY